MIFGKKSSDSSGTSGEVVHQNKILREALLFYADAKSGRRVTSIVMLTMPPFLPMGRCPQSPLIKGKLPLVRWRSANLPNNNFICFISELMLRPLVCLV